MGIMDLSMNQEEMGVQDRFGNQVFKLNKFDETDVKGNNNLYNSRKTDTEDSVSLFKDAYSSEHLQVDPSLFSYSSFKKAMDLRTHNRTDDEKRRTIFDDADYFAKNFFYKLLPITFEQVDETIIHTEHNYSLFSLNSESDTEEDCSRTMDYSQIKEKNYKRRRTKFREGSSDEMWSDEKDLVNYNENISNQKPSASLESEPENAVQPLDLRTAPSVQEQKTDNHHHSLLKDCPIIREENLPSKLKSIQVTITRPDEKENYQPCDMFLNDIARLVPRLINNDCFEIDILDKTGDRHDDFQKHRLYYIIAESTWRLFQSTRERVILTNDHTLGPPVKKMEQDERPTFLVFDQFSLAKCLADYCEEIGGCFEYTRVEGRKEEEKEDVKHPKMIDMVTKVIEMNTNDEKTIDIKAAELKIIESNIEEIQMEESNVKLQNITAEEQTPDAKESKIIDEGISSDNSGTETSEKPKKEDNVTQTRNEKLEEETKVKERNIEETEKVELKANENITNAMEEKEILKKMDAEDSSLKVYKRKMKINKNKIKNKETEKNTKKRGKFTISTRNIKSNKTCKRKAKAIDFEKLKARTSDDETKIVAVNAESMKPTDIDTKETKDFEKKTDVEDTKVCEKQKAKTVALSFEETIKEDSKKPKSEDENMEKTTETEPQKRMLEATDAKKTKKLNRKTEKYREETKTSVTNAKEIKMGKGSKKQITETKPNKGKEDESKNLKIVKNETSVQESEISEKDIKTPRKGRKPNEQTEKADQIKMKNKGKLIDLREDKSPLPKKTRNNMKSEDKLPVLVPRVKTRSKSTSESDSSQKPNKVITKRKITEKKVSAGLARTRGSPERRTRSGKGTEERKQGVKVKANETSGRGLRGTKRKVVEEMASDERCLRPRGEEKGKEKIENVGTFGKRRKR